MDRLDRGVLELDDLRSLFAEAREFFQCSEQYGSVLLSEVLDCWSWDDNARAALKNAAELISTNSPAAAFLGESARRN